MHRVRRFPTFAAMLEAVGVANCLPGVSDVAKGVAVYTTGPHMVHSHTVHFVSTL